jgi:predicted nucleic acid-binding Zn ribbon protein
MKSSIPTTFDKALSSALDSLGLSNKIKQYDVINLWSSIVGQQIATVASAERIEKGILFVHVKTSPWRNELIFLKKTLIKKINEEMHQEVVNDIVFR